MNTNNDIPKGAGKKLVLVFIFLFILFQFIQVDLTNPEFNKNDTIKAPKEIMAIFKKACYDCHSNETVWPWYSHIAPFSWSINRHVNNGRAYLNFSIWEQYTKKQKNKILEDIYRAVYAAMPPKTYTYIHKNAILTKEQRDMVRKWTNKSPYQ